MNSLRLPGISPFCVNGRGAGEHQNGGAALGRVVDRACQGLRAALHMHEHGLRDPRRLPEPVRGAHADHLVRASDDLGDFASRRPRLGDRLDEGGVVAAEVDEQIGDASLDKSVQESAAGGVHGVRE